MDYQTYAPDQPLAGVVKCFWTLDGGAEYSGQRQTIIPDGCMEMIFHYGDLYRQYRPDNSYFLQPRCFVFGQITSRLEIAPDGLTGIFAVRFLPYGFLPFSALPIVEMENRAVDVDALFGEAGIELAEQVLQAENTTRRIQIVAAFLENRMKTEEAISRAVQAGVDLLVSSRGELRVPGLADKLGINRRTLERQFAAAVGLGPGQLAKMIRLQATIQMLMTGNYQHLTDLAYENGYADQAHFIRDFREFAGVSPRYFYSESLEMSTRFLGTV